MIAIDFVLYQFRPPNYIVNTLVSMADKFDQERKQDDRCIVLSTRIVKNNTVKDDAHQR